MHHGKRNTLFWEEKGFFICSDVDKYKYSSGDHKIVATLRSPGHFFLLPFVEMAVFTNDFLLVEVQEGLPEGKGLFSNIDIPHYTFLCNYWGKLLLKQEGFDYMDGGRDFCYLYEFSCELNAKNTTYSLHSNTLPKVFFQSDGKPEIMFISLSKILAGEEILFDYGCLYKGVKNCF